MDKNGVFSHLIAVIDEYESGKKFTEEIVSYISSAVIKTLSADDIRVKTADDAFIRNAVVSVRYYQTKLSISNDDDMLAKFDSLPTNAAETSSIGHFVPSQEEVLNEVNAAVIAVADDRYPAVNNIVRLGSERIIIFSIQDMNKSN